VIDRCLVHCLWAWQEKFPWQYQNKVQSVSLVPEIRDWTGAEKKNSQKAQPMVHEMTTYQTPDTIKTLNRGF
jgi:hypothetical protein